MDFGEGAMQTQRQPPGGLPQIANKHTCTQPLPLKATEPPFLFFPPRPATIRSHPPGHYSTLTARACGVRTRRGACQPDHRLGDPHMRWRAVDGAHWHGPLRLGRSVLVLLYFTALIGPLESPRSQWDRSHLASHKKAQKNVTIS